MKRSLFLLITMIFASHTMSQILYDGMYSGDWETERDALVFGGQNSEQRQWIQEQERKRQEQERAIQNLRIEIPSQHQSTSPKGMSQAEYNRRIAEKNRQIAIRNKQIQQRNQQLALQRRQQQIAAEKRKQEEIRIQREREQQKREETRQRVAEETYQRLESQTRNLQNAAAYASGEGAYRLREQHDVSRYETPIRQGTGNVVNQIDYRPKQKFSTPSNSFVIDPNRQYNLATWEEKASEDLVFNTPITPIPHRSDEEAWHYFHKTISEKHAIAYMAIMRDMEGGELPTAFIVDGGYAFASKNKKIVYKVGGDGNSMWIVNLDEPENAEFKREFYAETNLGKALMSKTPLNDKIMDSEVTLEIGDDAKISNNKDGLKMKMEIDQYTDRFKFKEKFGEESKDNSIGIAGGAEIKLDNMSKMKVTYIQFVSNNYALVNSGGVEAGQKFKVGESIRAKTSTKMESDIGFDASADIEGLAGSITTGYLHLSDKGVTIKEVGIRGGWGASVGAKFGLKGGALKGGAFSFAWNLKSKYYPY